MNHARGKTSWYGKDPTSRSYKLKGAAIAASAGLAAAALAAVPASGSETGAGVRAGSNIMVMHNIDFVAVGGYGPAIGGEVTVEVLRNDVVIGSATGPAIDAEGAPGLEVNHGPEGAAVAGDCFDLRTPDIQPGDVIHVTDAGGTDEITVDDLKFTGEPFLAPNRDVLVDGVARTFRGAPIALARLDSAEFRDGSPFRVFANEMRVTRRAGVVGGFRLRVNPNRAFERNRDNRTPAQIRRTLLNVDGWAMGFGHIEPAPADAQLVEGVGDTPGPAPGCEAAPSASWGVTTVFPGSINRANQGRGLTVRGIATGATGVNVRLTDGTGAPVTKAVTPTGNNWTATFAPGELTSLNGNVRVAGLYDVNGGQISGKTATVLKDLVAPNAPRASLRQGTYQRPRRTALLTAAGNTIRYTVGAGAQARPTANRGAIYRSRIRLAAPRQVIKAVAIDRAGNVSPVKRLVYRIR